MKTTLRRTATWLSRILLVPTAVMLAIGAPATAFVTERGGSIYPIDVNTVLAGVMPPPGDYACLYGARYDANHTLDSNRNDRPNIRAFNAHVKAFALRYDHVWKDISFLGANLMTRGRVFCELAPQLRRQDTEVHRRSTAFGYGIFRCRDYRLRSDGVAPGYIRWLASRDFF